MSLTLTGDKQSGTYTCIIDDENDITQSVYIGIYNSLTEVEHEGEYNVQRGSESQTLYIVMID